MKRICPIVAVALCVALGMFALVGCSSGSSGSSGSNGGSPAFNYDGTIEKTTIVDNDILTVTADELTYENNQATLALTITNKTAGELQVAASTLAYPANFINGYMVPDGWFNKDVAAGATETAEASFSLDELRMYGIKGINDIGLGIYATDSNYDTVYQDVSTIKTSLGDSYSDSSFKDAINDSSIQSALNATITNSNADLGALTYNGLQFNTVVLAKNSDGENALMFEVENTTDVPMIMQCHHLKVNDQLAYEYAVESVYLEPGKKRVATVDLSYYLEEAELSDLNDSITNVTFTYSLIDEKYNTLAGDTEASLTF